MNFLLKYFFLYPIYSFCVISLFLVQRLIFKFYLIRVIYLNTSRIGHLSNEIEIYLCKKKFEKKKSLDLFYPSATICNNYFYELVKKKIFVIPRFIGGNLEKLNRIFDVKFKLNPRHTAELTDRDTSNLYYKINQQITINKQDIEKGNEIIKKNFNINEHDKLVCVIFRDSAYLKEIYKNEKDFSYHDYRNADILNFKSSAYYLLNKGYKVVRVGSIAKKKLDIDHENFIDYPFQEIKSDFLDIYLIHRCSFLVTTSLGLDGVASVFRKPMVTVNMVPIGLLNCFHANNFMIFRKYFSLKNKEFCTLSTIFSDNLSLLNKKNQFVEKNIKLVENSEDEILNVVKDCEKYISNELIIDIDLQKKFWGNYRKNFSKYVNSCIDYETNSIISESFLNNNNFFFE